MASVSYLPYALEAEVERAQGRIRKERSRKRLVAALALMVGALALTTVLWASLH